MAPRKRKTEKALDAFVDIKRLWRKVEPQLWYSLLREVAPQQKWQLNGRTIKGICPYHQDTDPSFVLDFSRGMGKCFGSCEKYVGDIIQLFAKLRGCSYAEALIWLNTKVDLSDVLGDSSEELAKYHHMQEMKKAAAKAFSELCLEYLRDKPAYLAYMTPALVYLEKGRGISTARIPELPVAVFGKPEHVKKHMSVEFHDAYDEYFSEYQKPKFWGSIIFHYNDSPGTISRFKVRHMDTNAESALKRFPDRALMTSDDAKQLCLKDFTFLKDPYAKQLGVFGLHHYNRMIGKADSAAYITEGEFDALSVMLAQIELERYDVIMLAAGGKSGTALSFLREMGIRTLWVVQDSPAKNGDSVASSVLRSPGNHEGDGVNRPLRYKLFCWPPELPGGDLDEAVQLNGYERVSQYLYLNKNAYFMNALPWVMDKCGKSLNATKEEYNSKILALDSDSPTYETEKKNLLDDKGRIIRDTILDWFKCLHDPSDKLTYTQHYAHQENIDIALLNDVRTSVYSLNTVEGAKECIRQALKDHVEFAFYESGKTQNQFYLWSKKKFELVALPLSDSGMSSVLSQYVGKSMLEWMKSLLGESSVLNDRCKADGPIVVEKQRYANALFIIRQVIEDMTSECRQRSTLRRYGQGIHFYDLPNSAKREGYVYFVNGSKVFRGKYAPESGLPVEWEFLNNVVDDNMLFSLHPSSTWSYVDDVSDLYAGNQVDLPHLYNSIRKILDGWKFEHHEIMRDYIAAYILSIPIQRAIGQVNITFLTGESTSGKTTFLKGLLGGMENSGHDVQPILEAAKFATDATPAWIAQEMDGSSLLLALDEAESGNETEHSTRVNEIQNMFYSIPTGGTTVTRGGSSADQRASYYLRMPVVMGGINMNANPTFLTRVMVIYTQKDPARRAVGDYISDNFSDYEIEEIRKKITVCLLPYLPELIAKKEALGRRLSQAQVATQVTSRFITSVLTVLTVYEFIDPVNNDPVQLFKDIVSKNRSRLEAVSGFDFQSELINAVLYTDAIKTALDDGVTGFTKARSLIKEGDIDILNNSDCGVYCIVERRWIVIVWRLAKYTILQRTPFGRQSEASMKEAVSKNRFVVHGISADDHAYIQEQLGLTDIKSSSEYTVVSLEYLMTKDEQDAMAKVRPANGQSRTVGPQPDPNIAYSDADMDDADFSFSM